MEFIFLSFAAHRSSVAVLQNSGNVVNIIDLVFVSHFNGRTSGFATPHIFQGDQSMGKIALHGPKEVLIRLDRGIARHGLRRRHSFACKGFWFSLRLFPFISIRDLFLRHVIRLFGYDSFFDELIDGQGQSFLLTRLDGILAESLDERFTGVSMMRLSFGRPSG